jgi:hypothetical protein
MDAGCFGASCTALKTQAFTEANKCAVPDNVKENVEGCKFYLNVIQKEIQSANHVYTGLTTLPGMAM